MAAAAACIPGIRVCVLVRSDGGIPRGRAERSRIRDLDNAAAPGATISRVISVVAKDRSGRPVLVLGLTRDNLARLDSKPIFADAADTGAETSVVIFSGDDVASLKAWLVRAGLADQSLLAVAEPTPTVSQEWVPPTDET